MENRQERKSMERVRAKVSAEPRRMPAWLFSIVFHGGMMGLFALLMPALIFHAESFGPPVQLVQRIEPKERELPRWKPMAEMPPSPEIELVFEPVEECEAREQEKPADCDATFTVLGDLNPLSSYPVLGVGHLTRARAVRPVAASTPAVAEPVASGHVAASEAPVVAPTARPGGPYRAARVLGELDPRYPERQRAAGRSATVLLLVYINESGQPANVQLLSDDVHPDFAKAAVSAARKACYEPALAEGKSIPSQIRVRVRFQLQ
jgi:TonB family protein